MPRKGAYFRHPASVNQELGKRGEELAAAFLQRAGLEILDRNWRCAAGEIDLLVRDCATVAAIEVKTRTTSRTGHPLEAITPRKLHRLHLLLRMWVNEKEMRGYDRLRVDGLAITLLPQVFIDYRKGI